MTATRGEDAVCWCLVGAVAVESRGNRSMFHEMLRSLKSCLPAQNRGLAVFNDQHPHWMVLELIEKAIRKEKRQRDEILYS